MKVIFLMITMLWLNLGTAQAQSPAAIAYLEKLYTTEQIQEMRNEDPAKYHSMVWYLAHSFLIDDQGVIRTATETEIAALQIKTFDYLRMADQRVTTQDPTTGLTLILFGADECFERLQGVLPNDQWQTLHDQYMRNKAARTGTPLPKSNN